MAEDHADEGRAAQTPAEPPSAGGPAANPVWFAVALAGALIVLAVGVGFVLRNGRAPFLGAPASPTPTHTPTPFVTATPRATPIPSPTLPPPTVAITGPLTLKHWSENR